MSSEEKRKLKQTDIGMIPEEWQAKRVREFCLRITSGGTPSRTRPEYWDDGTVPWLKTQELTDNNIYEAEEKITQIGLENSSAKLFSKNTVLMAMYGATVGKLGILKIEATTNQAVCAMIVNERIADYRYLFYSLLNGREKLINLACGAAQQNLNQDIIKDFLLPFPNLQEQKSITKILSDIDSKIELNCQMEETLEAIGQAVFKCWFVDFEFPNEEGKPYKSSGGEMVHDAVVDKEIPEGWVTGSLGNICEITMGQSPPGETYNETEEGVPFFQGIRDFGFRFPSRRVYCTAPTRFAQEGDVLLSVRAPVGSLNVADVRCAIGRGVAALRLKGKQNSFLYYLLLATRSAWDKYDAKGTVFGAATKQDVHDFKIAIPPKDLRDQFGELNEPLDQKILLNDKESRNLTAIRDSLLPKLMSGKIRVPVKKENVEA